jgi:phage tail-like protein
MHDSNFRLPVVFYFAVDIKGQGKGETSFSEISGLDIEKDIEEISEGGVNNFKHRLPGRTKYSNLVLKRGLAYESGGLFEWVQKILTQDDLEVPMKLQDISIHLLHPSGGKNDRLVTWEIKKAYPVKWSVSGFNSTENAIVIESLEFAFQSVEVIYK